MEANERTIDVEEVGDVVCHLNIPQNGVDSGLGSDSEDGESSRDNTQKPSPSIARKLWNSFRDKVMQQNDIKWSKKFTELPCRNVVPFKRDAIVAATGPAGGIKKVDVSCRGNKSKKNTVAGIPNKKWSQHGHYRAYGMSTSLYERNPMTNTITGDPVADVYSIIARPNNCILALADGVNWGEKSRLAARCAVAGSLNYLNENLFAAVTTHDIFRSLVKSFEYAQSIIIKSEATMTTLCTAVVCELEGSEKWGLCCINVGDSLAFVYNQRRGVREITIGSHFGEDQRDMRNPGGSLGPADGYNPDLGNLTFSFTFVEPGDIVFLTSDGVSDNFDPVVAKCKHCDDKIRAAKSHESVYEATCFIPGQTEVRRGRSNSEPQVFQEWDFPGQRHQKMLKDMAEAIEEEGLEDKVSAMEICAKLISNVARRTAQKRQLLEQADLENKDITCAKDRRAMEKQIAKVMKETPGKLDHAAVVALEVGEFRHEEPLKLVSKGFFGERLSTLRQRLSSSSPPSSPESTSSSSFGDGFQEVKNLLVL